MDWRRISLLVTGTALAYFGLVLLNEYLFATFSFSTDTNWIFLPNGVRLVAVLLFVQWGALGIVLAGIGLQLCQPGMGGDPATAAVSICLSGLAPLLARQICIGANELRADLTGLSPADLLRTTLIFSAISAALGQIWLAWNGLSPDALTGFIAMFTGNLVGALIVLYASKLVLSVSARLRGG